MASGGLVQQAFGNMTCVVLRLSSSFRITIFEKQYFSWDLVLKIRQVTEP
jgi:hypothetical protein